MGRKSKKLSSLALRRLNKQKRAMQLQAKRSAHISTNDSGDNECKSDWSYPSMSEDTNELLRQCAALPATEVSDDVDELIARSKAFPVPFPIETVRMEQLKVRRPIEKLKKNIVSTYPLIHERVLLLMTHFLIYKREFGSSIEKELYKDMGVAELIDRVRTVVRC